MLIRSQNREILINFNTSVGIDIEEGPMKTTVASYATGCRYLLGEYSNKQKAVKVAQRKHTERGNCGSSGRRDCTIDCTGSKKRGIREHESLIH